MYEVLKRDKRTKECFQETKIHCAIEKAYKSVGKEMDEDVFSCVMYRLGVEELNDKEVIENTILRVEDIQDSIEKCLFENDLDVALAFHDYRLTHKLIRDEKKGLVKEFTKKLMCENIENQNANVDENTHGGKMAEAADVFKKDFALNNCVSKQTKRNHLNNESYIHDLNSLASGEHNCLSKPFDKLLSEGAKVGQTDIRPAGSVNSAMQLTAVYFQIQSQEEFGGVSATHYDWTMVPYVRKSFFKHYVLNYLKQHKAFSVLNVLKMTNDEIDEWVETHKSEFLENFGLKFSDFRLDNLKNLDDHLGNAALLDTRIELMQAVEALMHNLNTLQSRPGSQLPFTSINYGSCTLPEGQLVIEALLDGSLRGVGKYHLTPIFPCGIFQLKKGVNRKPGDPNYYLFRKALMSTSRRIYPNYANLDWSSQKAWKKYDIDVKTKVIEELSEHEKQTLLEYVTKDEKLGELLTLKVADGCLYVDEEEKPYEIFSTMGCRTANGADVNFGELYERNIKSVISSGKMVCDTLLSACQKDGRGNICPQTIIMPTLAMEVLEESEIEDLRNGIISGDNDKKVDKFMRLLSRKIDQTKDSLIDRFEWIASQSPKSAPYMWGNGTMAGYIPEEGIRSALIHGTLAIGQLGLAETLQILIGTNQTTEEGMDLAKRIERLFKKKCNDFKEEYKLNFGVYYTPAENLCHTALKKFRAKYGIIPKVSDRDYFTNSMHVPVWETMTPFKKVDIESELTGYSSAGCITYVEVDSKVSNNIDGMETMVNYMMDSDIPYGAINFPIDNCLDCGHSGEMRDGICPICGSNNIEHLGRVTGYLSSDVRRFNKGKQSEFGDRVHHEEYILI